MVVHHLNVVGVTVTPHETNPILLIDPDAVLAAAIAAQRFKPIAGRAAQVPKVGRSVEHDQLSLGSPLYLEGRRNGAES